MFLNQGLNDNLTLRRGEGGRRPWRLFFLALLLAALAAGAGWYVWQAARRAPGAGESRAAAPARPGPEQQTLVQIRELLASGMPVQAREHCYRALEQARDPAFISEVERRLGQINLKLLLTPEPMPEKVEYIVQAGDSLERIAKQFGTTVELIRKSNALKPSLIHPGDRLLIFKATLALTVSKSRNDLLLKANDVFFKRYPVGTGQHGKTPAGTFVIADKIVDPPWWRPDGEMIPFGDKENVLGTRWMSIVPVKGTPAVSGYGIHGTWEPNTIGQQASAGCIRMLNSDVEELFMLVPLRTPVTIEE